MKTAAPDDAAGVVQIGTQRDPSILLRRKGEAMIALIQAFAGTTAWVSVVLAFVALPGFYIFLAIDVHKEYADLVKFTDGKLKTRRSKTELLEAISKDLSIFELDWWIVAATAVLLGMISALPQLLAASDVLKGACTTLGETANAAISDCDRQQSLLRLYCVLVGLAIGFRLGWARVAVAKELKYHYARIITRS